MALTLDNEQKLESAGLIAFFENDQAMWTELAQSAYTYVKSNFPVDSKIRRDDIAKALKPVVEVTEGLQDYLSANKLKQKYWVEYFTDLVIDRTWSIISEGD